MSSKSISNKDDAIIPSFHYEICCNIVVLLHNLLALLSLGLALSYARFALRVPTHGYLTGTPITHFLLRLPTHTAMLSLFLLCVSVVRQQQGQAGRRPECVIVDAGDQLIKMERSRANHSVSRE